MSEWIDQHLEEFVKPQLGRIPNVNLSNPQVAKFDRNILRALWAVWQQCKKLAGHRPILLPGRDTYLLEVLARCEGWPTTFRQDISGQVARSGIIGLQYENYHVFDTGFSGSVPKALGAENWHLICCHADPQHHQIFPKTSHRVSGFEGRYVSPIRYLASVMEMTSKYWESAFTTPFPVRVIIQELTSSQKVFEEAVMLTRHVANFEKEARCRYSYLTTKFMDIAEELSRRSRVMSLQSQPPSQRPWKGLKPSLDPSIGFY
jgi:hypothetical protein